MDDEISLAICAVGAPWIAHGAALLLGARPLCGGVKSAEALLPAPRPCEQGEAPGLVIWCAPSTYCVRAASETSRARTVLFSTGWLETETAVRSAGLSGYVGPRSASHGLRNACRIVLAGGFSYSPGPASERPIASLTRRQQELMRWVGAGLADGEIACRMTISERTVRFHLEALLARLGVSRRGEIIALAAIGGMSGDEDSERDAAFRLFARLSPDSGDAILRSIPRSALADPPVRNGSVR